MLSLVYLLIFNLGITKKYKKYALLLIIFVIFLFDFLLLVNFGFDFYGEDFENSMFDRMSFVIEMYAFFFVVYLFCFLYSSSLKGVLKNLADIKTRKRFDRH